VEKTLVKSFDGLDQNEAELNDTEEAWTIKNHECPPSKFEINLLSKQVQTGRKKIKHDKEML
jgi:hypothetical protein